MPANLAGPIKQQPNVAFAYPIARMGKRFVQYHQDNHAKQIGQQQPIGSFVLPAARVGKRFVKYHQDSRQLVI